MNVSIKSIVDISPEKVDQPPYIIDKTIFDAGLNNNVKKIVPVFT
jgi:hypothetical protein